MLSQNAPRRTRAPIACQRCKRRKTKCNGETPVCSACQKSGTSCTWPAAVRGCLLQTTDQSQLLQYAAQLESKVAYLESKLRSQRDGEQRSAPEDDHAPSLSPAASATNVTYNGGLSTDMALLSMSATGEPLFVGATSGFSLSKLVEGVLSESLSAGHHELPTQISRTETALSERRAQISTANNAASVQAEEMLVDTFFSKVHPRYPFVSRPSVYEIVERRKNETSNINCDEEGLFLLYIICAISARVVQLHPELAKSASPEVHFSKALKYMNASMAQQSLRRIQALLLLAIYLLRTPGNGSNLGSWHIIGVAVRCAVEMGLHRNFRGKQESSYELQIRRRTFWSAYVLDRAVSLTLGRPFALAEHDIDVPLPLDNDDTQPTEADLYTTPSNISSFIHMCRLRRIESKIQREIYAADVEICILDGSHDDKIDNLLESLNSWRQAIPANSGRGLQSEKDYSIYDTEEFLNIQYSKALRMLMQPRISLITRYVPSDNKTAYYLGLSARAAGDICQYYKTLHQRRPLGWNLLALHSIFMAGLTLLYCTWAWKGTSNLSIFEDIRSCSNVLFAISERWPTAKRFRDVFEVLAKKMTDIVVATEHHNQPAEDRNPEEEGDVLNHNENFPSPGFENFWSMFDDLVDDEYIRNNFGFYDGGEESGLMDFS